MNQKIAFALAAALTAFVLVVGGALAGRMTQPPAAPTTAPLPTEVQSLITQREAEYRARLEEANQALANAYAAQSAATATPAPTPEPLAATAPQVQLSPQDALFIAAFNVPNARILGIPELVDYQGAVAYEVHLAQGTLYIDAQDGTLLYNGASQTTLQGSSHGGEHEREHEHDDDDD